MDRTSAVQSNSKAIGDANVSLFILFDINLQSIQINRQIN